jgi:hypothetical protein
MGAYSLPGIFDDGHGVSPLAFHAKHCFEPSHHQLQDVVFLVRGALNNLIKGSNDDAANNEPLYASHDDSPGELSFSLALNL